MGAKGSTEEFMRDVDSVVTKILEKLDHSYHPKIRATRDDLERLHRQNRVKINHSVMELICATHLINAGFDVQLETAVNGGSTHVYAGKGPGAPLGEGGAGWRA